MNRNEENRKTWNKIAQLYQDKFMNLDLYNHTYDYFCDLLAERKIVSVFELGCGPGNITRYLLRKRSDFNFLATDAAPAMIELAKSNVPEAEFEVMDSRDLNKLESKYDAFVCGFCIPYLSKEETLALINQVGRLLFTGGIFYLSFVEGNPQESGYITGSTGDRVYFYYHELEKLIRVFEANNMQIEKKFNVEYFKDSNEIEMHTILLLRKQK